MIYYFFLWLFEAVFFLFRFRGRIGGFFAGLHGFLCKYSGFREKSNTGILPFAP